MKLTGQCDGPACERKAEIDINHGKPPGWWTVRVTGHTISNEPQPVLKKVDHTTVLCEACFRNLGIPVHVG